MWLCTDNTYSIQSVLLWRKRLHQAYNKWTVSPSTIYQSWYRCGPTIYTRSAYHSGIVFQWSPYHKCTLPQQELQSWKIHKYLHFHKGKALLIKTLKNNILWGMNSEMQRSCIIQHPLTSFTENSSIDFWTCTHCFIVCHEVFWITTSTIHARAHH